MAFQIKDFVSIAASMINHAKATQSQITDFYVGSVARTMLEAPAIEIEELYQQMFRGLLEAIPVSTYTSFGFDKLPATAATGLLQFSSSTPVTTALLVPSGTRAQTIDGTLTYTTTADATIAVGQSYVDAVADCQTVGAVGNVAPQQVAVMLDSVAGVDSVTNLAAFTGGTDEESDGAQQMRFATFIATLPRGTKAAIEYGARQAVLTDSSGLTAESVQYVYVDEPYLTNAQLPVGLVDCYIHNGVGDTSQALVAQAQQIINGYRDPDGTPHPGWKAAGVIVSVSAAQDVPIAITAALTVSATSDATTVQSQIVSALATYLQGLGIGVPVYLSELIAIAMGVPGVENFVLSAPTADVSMAMAQKALLGTVTWT